MTQKKTSTEKKNKSKKIFFCASLHVKVGNRANTFVMKCTKKINEFPLTNFLLNALKIILRSPLSIFTKK